MPGISGKITRTIDTFTDYCGKTVAWLTAAMVVVTCTIVVMRYALESGSIALQESLTYLHGLVFMGGISFTLKRGGHVRVDIFYRKFSTRSKAYVDLAGPVLLLLPVTLVIFWLSLDYVNNSWAIKEVSSESTGLPWVYLLKTLLLIMPVALLLQGFAEFLKALHIVCGVNASHTSVTQNTATKPAD
ncbi:MAG: TRAP transporter small permease subunit [Porticoccaceae bacterium]|nr:TRAP transporter small permease subunit [Porticoccaceae bacterium]